MDKHEVLAAITQLTAQGNLAQPELLAAFKAGQGSASLPAQKFGITEVLSYIGGGIIALGIAILIYQHWDTLNTVAQLTVTLGVGIALYAAAVLLSQQEHTKNISQAFWLASAIVLPIGLGVAFDQAGYDATGRGVVTTIASLLMALFLVSDLVFKKNIFTLFSMIYGTAFFFTLTTLLAGNGPELADWHFQEYRVLAVGMTYVLLGYGFLNARRQALTGLLYGFGVLGFLGAALALGGWSPTQNIIWEALFPGLVFAIIFLSLHLKSKSFLTFGALFLMAYIMKLTAEYFSDSLGWPLALVLAGLLLIGIGYITFYLNKRYIKNDQVISSS